MTIGSITNRLAKLERSYSPDKLVIMIRDHFSDSPVTGYMADDVLINRLPDEPVEALLERAKTAAIAASAGRDYVVLCELVEEGGT